MTKEEARKVIRAKKRVMQEEEVQVKSLQVMKNLESLSCYLNAKAVYCYVSYNQEVDTKGLILQALKAGKKVAVPRVELQGERKEMIFYYIHSLDDLHSGYQGILEPAPIYKADDEYALLIMPGLAFDENKNRVGYGGGFYDRYLSSHTNVAFHKVALAFDFQVVDQLEVWESDEKADVIVTDKRIY